VADSALVYHVRGPEFDPSRGSQNIYVSPLEKDRQPPESIFAQKHLSKNPPFGTGIKTLDPTCLW